MSEGPISGADDEPGPAEARLRSTDAVRLGFLVWDVARLWRVALDRALKPLDVTRSQYSVIAFLARRDGMTQSALASDLELTKVAVGGLLERMEAVGLVERRADGADARVRRVYLTRKGMRITQKIRELAEPIETRMLSPVSDDDLAATIRSLALIKGKFVEFDQPGVVDAHKLPRTMRRRGRKTVP